MAEDSVEAEALAHIAFPAKDHKEDREEKKADVPSRDRTQVCRRRQVNQLHEKTIVATTK